MALEATIMADLKEAMKAKDKVTLEALRAIKTAILNEKTAAGAKEMTEADELKLLTKLRKRAWKMLPSSASKTGWIWQNQKKHKSKSSSATFRP